ncbi:MULTISPECIES: hypothetical protein [unclassified Streptomyces]|uniref:hypothetical protein n=1 Tax=unclassified Streptomyces TaxID=2593676 RepID=UPI0007C64521|nr:MULTISPECIES: hypothetical protein [unclassified Streptomyces]
MVISHHISDGTLHVRILHELDVTDRAAAALQIESLVHAHRPERVTVELPSRSPSPMTFSALARAQRMCQSLGVPSPRRPPADEPRSPPSAPTSPAPPAPTGWNTGRATTTDPRATTRPGRATPLVVFHPRGSSP